MSVLRVATGVVTREDGRFLLTQRGFRSDFAYTWESPGGKIEPGEMARDAVARELHEEIGFAGDGIAETPFLDAFITAGSRQVHILFFRVRAPTGFVPDLARDANVIGAGWFTHAEMRSLRLMPGNVRLLAHLDGEAA